MNQSCATLAFFASVAGRQRPRSANASNASNASGVPPSAPLPPTTPHEQPSDDAWSEGSPVVPADSSWCS